MEREKEMEMFTYRLKRHKFFRTFMCDLLIFALLYCLPYITLGATDSNHTMAEGVLCKPTPVIIASGVYPTPTPTPHFTNEECHANCDMGSLIGGTACSGVGGALGFYFVASMPAIGFIFTVCATSAMWGNTICKDWCNDNYPN